MPSNYLTLSRQALYELVWSKPMTELAQEFGISDRGLAKRCQAVDVPVPPRGYWARFAAGQKPPRIPLPYYRSASTSNKQSPADLEPLAPTEVIRDGPEPRVNFTLRPGPAECADKPLPNCSPEESAPRARIDALEIPPLRLLAHAVPAIKRTALRLKFATVKDLSFGRGERVGSILSVHVSDERDIRALQLADALLTASQQLGWSFDADPPPEPQRYSRWNPQKELEPLRAGRLVVEGEPIRLKVDERMRQVPHVLTVDELDTKKRGFQIYPPKWDHEPSGELRVHLTRLNGCVFKTRKDGARRPLEEQLRDLLHDALDYAIKEKLLRSERLLAEERARERERLELLAQERFEAQEKLIHEFERQAGAWHRARFLRRYLYAARCAAGSDRHEVALGDQKIDFLEWAETYIDQLDPLSGEPRNRDIMARCRDFSCGSEAKQLHESLSRLVGDEWQRAGKVCSDDA